MPTEDEKEKKPFNLQNTPQSFADLGPDGREGMGGMASGAAPAQADPLSAPREQAEELIRSQRRNPEWEAAEIENMRTQAALNRENLRAQKFQNENAGQRNPTSLRTIEARERSAKQKEAKEAAEAQRREDFWNRGKATERPEAKAARETATAEFQQRQQSQRDRMLEKLKPIREKAFARQAAEKKTQEDMKDPAKRLAAMRMRAAELGATINYAEVGGPDGKKATYMRPTKEGTEGYLATRGNKNLQDMANKAQGMASAMPSPGLPQNMTAAASKAGIDRATNTMAAATPRPAAPNMVTPTFNPAQPAAQPSLMADTPAKPDPNAAAAIASFNQTAGNITRGSSAAQTANLRNLQRGDNVPTLANVPSDLANQAAESVGSFVREGMKQRPNRVRGAVSAVGDIIAGKKPLINPRRRTQTAQTQPKNPLLARR